MKKYNEPEMNISTFAGESVTTLSGGGSGTGNAAYSAWTESTGAATKDITLGEMTSITAYMFD